LESAVVQTDYEEFTDLATGDKFEPKERFKINIRGTYGTRREEQAKQIAPAEGSDNGLRIYQPRIESLRILLEGAWP
jgi:hypothetical protein